MAKIDRCPNRSDYNFKRLESQFGYNNAMELFLKFKEEAPHTNKFDNVDFTNRSILEFFSFKNIDQVYNYLDNTEGITKDKSGYYIKKDDPKVKEREFGLHKVSKLIELYPGLIKVDNLGASKDYGKRSITSSQPTYKISVNNNFFTSPTLFQLKGINDTPVNRELNDKLMSLLSKLGINVENFTEFQSKHDVDALGAIRIIKSINDYTILIDKDNATLHTLPEETAHFIIELLGDSPLGQRLLNSVRKNDYYKEVLGAEFEKYFEIYEGKEDILVKEAAGKLLSQALVTKFNELQGDKTTQSLLKRFWEYVKGIFNKIDNSQLDTIVDDIYGTTAKKFLEGELKGLSKENIKSDIMLFQHNDRSLDRLKTLLEEAQKASAKRLQIYRYKDKKKLIKSEEILLKKISTQLDNEKYIMGAVDIAKHTRDAFRGIAKRIGDLRAEFENLDNVNLKKAASTLRDMRNFSQSYLPIISEFLDEIEKLRRDFPEYKKYDTIVGVLEDLRRKASILNDDYYTYAIPLFAKYLKPFVGDGPLANLEDELKYAGKDISFLQRWLDAMAEVDDPISRLIDVAVKDVKLEAQQKALDIRKDLVQAKIDLEKASVKTADWIYERLYNGTLSGNLVSKYNYAEFEKNWKEKSKELLIKYKLPEDIAERHLLLSQDVRRKKDYNKEWAQWFEENTQNNPQAEDIINKKKKELSREDYDEWYLDNVNVSDFTGDTYYRGELSIPSEKYASKEYKDIQNNPAKKRFYDTIIRTRDELDKLLPEKDRLRNLAPQQRKDFIERLKDTTSLKEAGKNVKESISETFMIKEDELELGRRYKITDPSGKAVDFLPIYFNNKLEDMSNLSTDIVQSLSAFAYTTLQYSHMNKIIDVLELGRDILDVREVQKTDEKGNPVVESINILGKKIENKLKKDPNATNIKGRLDDYYNMVVYGKMQKEGVGIFGTKVDSEKLLNFLGKYTAINNLGLNIYAGIQNPIVGTIQIRTEAIAGQFFDNKNLIVADGVYTKNLPNKLGQMNSRNPNNFLDLWSEKFDVLQDFKTQAAELNMERKSIFTKLFSTSSLFFLNHAGEHYMQNRLSFALADSIKLKDSTGKEITLHEAYEVKGNKLVLKEGITKLDGTPWTPADERRFMMKQNAINKRLHGIYNDIDKSAIQYHAVGRLALMFRKFMRPGYNRRFRELQYNYEGQFETEGYYRTTGRFLKQLIIDLKGGQVAIMENWGKLSAVEKYNMIRTMTEAAYLTAAIVLANILTGLDDDDDWLANMGAYQANRLVTELFFYINPSETLKILNSPAAGISQLNKVINFIEVTVKPWSAFDEIERGKWKGYTRLHRSAVEVIPLYGSISDIMSPEVKLIYFTAN